MTIFRYIAFSFLLMIGFTACSTSERTVEESPEVIEEEIDDKETGATFSLQDYRSQLSDAYSRRQNLVPEYFRQVRKEYERESNEGYRIQIYSGENVAQADTVAAQFQRWVEHTLTGYQPETYIFFRTPYYRVHVGDFFDRDRAIELTNLVKKQYPDAWIVHDRVEPHEVPADTARISTKQ